MQIKCKIKFLIYRSLYIFQKGFDHADPEYHKWKIVKIIKNIKNKATL